ncbi:glycosyltransferase [Methanobacterium sp. ACI-7]|uniref:glycosyltransferase n=1 Tax=unclassified Methanobacterium TaxID=2627676 RepID=UPI0039C2843A
MSKDTVCAVIVTYNRKELLIECLESLKSQTKPLNAIYIIDNASTDGTPSLLLQNEFIEKLPPDELDHNWEKCFLINSPVDNSEIKLYYIRMRENTGGAGGFYEGVKRAYEKGYDWIWLTDGDTSHNNHLLERFSFYFEMEDLSALTNKVIDSSDKILIKTAGNLNFNGIKYPMNILKPVEEKKYEKDSVHEIELATFVSLLVNRKAIEEVGFPKKEFFIHFDDWEFCLRLLKYGKIFLITDCASIHKELPKKTVIPNKKNFYEKKFLGNIYLRQTLDNLSFTYFDIRNLIWTTKTHCPKPLFYRLLFTVFIKDIIAIILFDGEKVTRIKFTSNAYIDGFRGIFDNKKPQKLLYNK